MTWTSDTCHHPITVPWYTHNGADFLDNDGDEIETAAAFKTYLAGLLSRDPESITIDPARRERRACPSDSVYVVRTLRLSSEKEKSLAQFVCHFGSLRAQPQQAGGATCSPVEHPPNKEIPPSS